MTHAVTLDFHDTLFHCDEWFQLEVRDLPARFLSWLAGQPGQTRCETPGAEVTSRYRDMRQACIENGIEIDSVEGVSRICREIGLAVDEGLIANGVDVLMRSTLGTVRARPGAAELVRTLRASGIKLGVISNAIHHPFLEWALEANEMLGEFDLVLSSAKAGYYKSRIELYQLASEMLDVAAERTIHIGDSYRFDVIGASSAGMRTVWLNLTGQSLRKAGGPQPDLVVESLNGLAPLLFETFNLGQAPRAGVPHAV